MNDIRISGSGTVGSGEYNEVKISGSGRICGDVKCERFAVSGSAHSAGVIECSGELSVSGSLKTDGGVKADRARISGSTAIGGDLCANTLKIAGSAAVSGNCTVTEASISGSIKVGGGLSAEKLVLGGKATIEGLLNAETAEITLHAGCGCSEIGAIGGGRVTVRRHNGSAVSGLVAIFGGRGFASLKTTSIEADSVELENTTADTVRAVDVTLGDGCDIGTVEYSGTLTVSEKAKVGNVIKL